MKIVCGLVAALLLSGCGYQMQLMQRDNGQVYVGEVKSNGVGGGTLSVGLAGKTCMGNFVTASSGDSFGFAQTFGTGGSNSMMVQSFGASRYKALLSCSDGSGLRCDVVGSQSGAGICVDSNQKVYDLIYS